MNLGKLKSFRMLAAFVTAVVVLALAVSAIPASAEIPTDIFNFKGAPSDVSGPLPYGKDRRDHQGRQCHECDQLHGQLVT
jgi:hypothetical protein